jgi:hypothetical protein
MMTSEISIFLLKITGSIIDANKVDNERQLSAIDTFEILMEWKKQYQCSAMENPIAASWKNTFLETLMLSFLKTRMYTKRQMAANSIL